MGAAIVAILVKCIPYVLPFVLGGIGWLAKKAWNAIIGKISNEKVAQALETLGAKAAAVVDSLEQTIRPELAKATADGKLTKDEAKALAKMALDQLLGLATPEIQTLKRDGGMDDAAVEKLASTMLEQAVYRLPKPARDASFDFQGAADMLRPPQWQRAQPAPVQP